jgi:hypothetical protein
VSYSERSSPTINIGCLPAGIFGLLIGAPVAFMSVMGECVDANGSLASCPHKRLDLLAIALIIAAACLLITWTTNHMVRRLTHRGRGAAWGVAAGFALATALAITLFVGLIAFR